MLWCLVRQSKNSSVAVIAMKILCFSQTIVKIRMLTQGKYISDTILDFIKILDKHCSVSCNVSLAFLVLWDSLNDLSIITLMIIKNRVLWLARSFALSRYNHCAVIITLKARSFQNGSQIFWCFGVVNWLILLFSWIVYSLGHYSPIFMSPLAINC